MIVSVPTRFGGGWHTEGSRRTAVEAGADHAVGRLLRPDPLVVTQDQVPIDPALAANGPATDAEDAENVRRPADFQGRVVAKIDNPGSLFG